METEEGYRTKIKTVFGIDESSIMDYELTNILYKNKKRISEAINLGEECVEKYPNNEFFWKFLGFAYNLNEDFEKALECAFKRVLINPNDPYNWIDLSFAYRSYGEIIISDWLNFNLELFMKLYQQTGLKQLDHKNLLSLLFQLRKKSNSMVKL